MNKNKKKFLIISLTLASILLLIGITKAAFNSNILGTNKELIVGDIYMHYKESNQLVLDNVMPINIYDYQSYKINPIMATQEIIDNELMRCVNYLEGRRMPLSNGTIEEFCKGEGTAANDFTFQENLNNGDWFLEELITEMLSLNIIIKDGENYLVNPIMTNQEYLDNELMRCVNYFTGYDFDEGSDAESYCKGEGTLNELTIQEYLDEWISWAESESTFEEGFLNEGGYKLLNYGIYVIEINDIPYFEFEVSGKNTYTKKDVWYEIVLSHGDESATRTERIRDDLLRFSLVEVDENGKILNSILNNQKYSSLVNRRIWVDTIVADKNEEISRKYRLYMWIDESTIVGNTVDAVYDFDTWNKIYASIKVNVAGDFNEKIVETDANCFETEEVPFYSVNSSMTNEELNACISLFNEKFNDKFDEEHTIENFCKGKGTTMYGNPLIDYYTWYDDVYEVLSAHNIIIETQILQISEYDETCGSSVAIPRKINGKDVLSIGMHAFSSKGVTSVTFPNTILAIKAYSFENTPISKVKIPDSVIHLSCWAFDSGVIIEKSNDLVCVNDGK